MRIADCGLNFGLLRRNPQSTINPPSAINPQSAVRNPHCGVERETGIEPATNSLEGCDSTTELLPPTGSLTSLPCQPQLTRGARERRLVAREGLEPSKPLGRQIYSLLRLTASLPRQSSVCLETRCFPEKRSVPWSWRRDSNPRPADYKSAALPA